MPAAQRREQLLEVARQVFTRDGYWATTALRIGREAGVSERLVINHFGSKEGVFRAAVIDPILALLEEQNERARAGARSGRRSTPRDHRAAVRSFLSLWASLVKEQGPLMVSFMAELREFPDAYERLVDLVKERVDESARLTRLAAHRPEYRPFDARVVAYTSLAAATVAAVAVPDPEAFLVEYLDVTFYGILTEEGRAALSPR